MSNGYSLLLEKQEVSDGFCNVISIPSNLMRRSHKGHLFQFLIFPEPYEITKLTLDVKVAMGQVGLRPMNEGL